jgi:hypothetical protein
LLRNSSVCFGCFDIGSKHRNKPKLYVFGFTNKPKQTRNRSCFGLFRFEPKIIFVCFEDTLPRIKEHEYERQLDHYVLIQNSIDEADEENLGDLFLDLDGIEEITQAFSSREIREHMQPWEHGTTFTAFVNDRLQWTTDRVHEIRYRQLRRTLPMLTPLPIDAARSGSMGGKHGKGKGARKNAKTVPVQGGNRVKKSARATCYPARIRGSKQTSNPAQNHGLTGKPAQERSQDTLSRKRSREQDIAAGSN